MREENRPETVAPARATFGDFAKKWKHWARVFERRYRLPSHFTRDDIEQELALAAWQHWGKYDAERARKNGGSTDFARFIEWNAVKRTAKVIHKVRGVEQHRRKGPSKFDVPFASFSEEGERLLEQSAPAPQEELLARAQIYSALEELAGPRAPVVRALRDADGAVDLAAHAVYSDPMRRLGFRLASRAEAGALVRATIQDLATRMEAL